MLHAMMLEATDGRLFYAPLGDYPQKIIDLGTGTGIWALESMRARDRHLYVRAWLIVRLVGEKYPGAEILGLDLSPIQPTWVPPNVK